MGHFREISRMMSKSIYWFVLVFAFVFVPATVSAQTYEGNVDRADKGGIHGWLANPAYPNDSSFYEVWGEYTNPESNRTESCYIGGYLTQEYRPDVNQHLVVEGKHGFYLPATSCMFGRMVTIRVYGYDWNWDWWYEVQYASGQPGHSIIRAEDDRRGTVSGKLTTPRGTDLFDSFVGGLYPQVTLLRMTEQGYLNYESYQNQATGNCYVRENIFNCWEGWGENRTLPTGDYRLEISANGMQIYSEPFRYNGGDINLGDIVLIPSASMTVVSTVVVGRRVTVQIEAEHWNENPVEVCGEVRGRGVNTYDVNVSLGCQVAVKGKHKYGFTITVPGNFPAGMWVSYKALLRPAGNGWEELGSLWGSALIER